MPALYDNSIKDKAEIEAAQKQECDEIAAALLDIRRREGWGHVVIELRGGEIYEISVTYTRKKRVERTSRV